MDSIAPGDRVRPFSRRVDPDDDNPWINPNAYVVSIHGNDVYLLYFAYDNVFVEVSRDAIENKVISKSYTEREDWMTVYVSALDMGSAQLCGVVEGLLRNSKVSGKTYTGEQILDIRASGSGKTLLHMAALHGNFNAVKWLLANGKRVDEKDINGYPALWFASVSTHSLRMCKLLLEKGARPNLGLHAIRDTTRRYNVAKILMLYGGDDVEIMWALWLPRTCTILSRAVCSHAPISRLPADVLRTYLLPLLV